MIRLRTLFLIVAACAFLASIPRLLTGPLFFQRRSVIELLVQHSDITAATFGAFDDGGIEEVVSTRFSIPNRPNTYLSLGGLESHRNGKLQHLVIRQIGDLRFTITNEQQDAWRDGIDIGPKTQFPDIIPMKLDNVRDVVDNYDELYDYFAAWPSRSSPGKATTLEGVPKLYYVKKGDANKRRKMHEAALKGTDYSWHLPMDQLTAEQ